MRQIDANALFEKVGNIKPNNKSEYELIGKFMKMITCSPTVEQPHGEWIPCEERLPKERGYYLVTTDGSYNHVIDIAEYGFDDFIMEWNKASKILAWMTLPEPYKKEGDEK